MVLHPVYACVVGTQIKNVICVTTGDNYIAQKLAEASFGENALAIECSQYPVTTGDFYVDGVFYKADADDKTKPGKVVKRINTPDEDAYQANVKATEVAEQVADLAVNQEYLMMLVDENTTEDGADTDTTTDNAAADGSEETTSEDTASTTTEATE